MFREEAFAYRGQREAIDGLLRVTAPHEWMVLAGLVLALLAVAGWGVFGSVERSVDAVCVFNTVGRERFADAFADDPEAVSADTTQQDPDAVAADTTQQDPEAVAADTARYDSVVVAADSAQHDLEVLAVVPRRVARQLRVGMEARVLPADLLVSEGSGGGVVHAVVSRVSLRAVDLRGGMPDGLRDRLGDVGLSVPDRGHVVRLVLGSSVRGLADGDPCRARIVLERHAPARWLIP